MVSTDSVSRARELLNQAAACDGSDDDQRLERNLLIAAAFREILSHEPVVVGGTAEDFWTADAYHETDVDLITWPPSTQEQDVLRDLGFTKDGRHWVHEPSGVPVEIPESRLKGDLSRVHREARAPGVVAIISVEDLYLDRIRQSTMAPEDASLQTFHSAIAVAAANFFEMDWAYVDAAIDSEDEVPPALMRRIDKRVRRRVRDGLSKGRRRR
jgi:hypothetical protein